MDLLPVVQYIGLLHIQCIDTYDTDLIHGLVVCSIIGESEFKIGV